MTYGIYSGISAADLGYEPDLPVATCPKCDGLISRRQNPPRGLICTGCGMDYNDIDEIDTARAFYEAILWDDDDDQRDEDSSSYADAVAEGLERWTR